MKLLKVNRLGDVVVHSGIERLGNVFGEGVCRHGNDGDVRLLGVIHPPYQWCVRLLLRERESFERLPNRSSPAFGYP